MPISDEGPVVLRQGLEESVPEVVDPTWDEYDRVTHVEMADFTAPIETPSVPRFGGRVHLASLLHAFPLCSSTDPNGPANQPAYGPVP